jgi:hypothetical protein
VPAEGLLGAARLALRDAVAKSPAFNFAWGEVVEPIFLPVGGSNGGRQPVGT